MNQLTYPAVAKRFFYVFLNNKKFLNPNFLFFLLICQNLPCAKCHLISLQIYLYSIFFCVYKQKNTRKIHRIKQLISINLILSLPKKLIVSLAYYFPLIHYLMP